MYEIDLNEILKTLSRFLGNPRTASEALAEDAELDSKVTTEVDKLLSVLLVETINITATGKKIFSNKINNSFLYFAKTTEGVKRVSYSEWVELAEYIDKLDINSDEYEYFKVLINLIARKQYRMSASLILCYLVNIL